MRPCPLLVFFNGIHDLKGVVEVVNIKNVFQGDVNRSF